MALGLTVKATVNNANDSNVSQASATTAAFTPANNSLLVVVAGSQTRSPGSQVMTISDTAGLTWTARADAITASVDTYESKIWTAPVTTGSSMTVTCTGAYFWVGFAVIEMTGQDPTTPTGVNLAATTGPRSGAYSPALSGTSASDSIVIAGGFADGGTATKGASWTDAYDFQSALGGTLAEGNIEYISGAVSAANWAALDSSFATSAVAIEIKAAASGPTINTQPDDAVAWNGDTASFSVSATASAGSLTYQWQVSTDRCASFSNVSAGSGGTTANYTTDTLGFADHETFYRCAVTDSNGTTNTRGAALRINSRSTTAWLLN